MIPEGFSITNDETQLNIKAIHKYLSEESYWARGRTIDDVTKSIKHSLCFGLFHGKIQVGFARVVTDYTIFAWIMDVFILEKYKGLGLGYSLMNEIISHQELKMIKRWGLNTRDAQSFYKKFGFRQLKNPQYNMEKVDPEIL